MISPRLTRQIAPQAGAALKAQPSQTDRLFPALCVCVSFPQLDSLVHRFITLLADSSDSKASENRLWDANMACRKLAVVHPLLLLRCGALASVAH